MQQRQLRLGDVIDDYCTRERRVTNHAIVAMIGPEVKQTRCTTCDTEHEYKHAKVPRQRRKAGTPAALYSQVLAGAPKRVAHDEQVQENGSLPEAAPLEPLPAEAPIARAAAEKPAAADAVPTPSHEYVAAAPIAEPEEGPVHRPLIRATLPRPEGQPPPARPVPDFTIRQPGGRQNRFRHGGQGRGGHFQGNRAGGTNTSRGAMPRQGGGRPGQNPRGPQNPQGNVSSRHRRQGGQKRPK